MMVTVRVQLLSLLFLLTHFILPISTAPIVEQVQVIFSQPKPFNSKPYFEDLSISQLKEGLSNGRFTSEDLTMSYLNRIEVFQDSIRSIISLNPHALKEARATDILRRENRGKDLGSLHGIPFLVKDNIAIPARSGPTTAGSYALLNTTVIAPSVVVDKLLAAGGILLGTTNMDEFAQAKGDHPWGFSARGGQMKSIFGYSTATNQDEALANGFGDVCGSSGGSALAVSLGLAAFALGTQTGVSIVCPASRAAVVGFKPGQGGMTSMKGIIPISKHLDVVGPISRNVEDAQLVWQVIKHPKGWTDFSSSTISAQHHRSSKIRIGVPRKIFWDELDDMHHITLAMEVFLARLNRDSRFEIIEKEVVNITSMNSNSTRKALSIIASHELKLGINNYLVNGTYPSPMKSLRDIIDFNLENVELELPSGPFPAYGHLPSPKESYSDQSNLINSDLIEVIGNLNSSYVDAKLTIERVGWKDGFERYFREEGVEVDVMIIPTEGISGTMASLARVPQITIPLSYYPSSYNIDTNATIPLYPYPSMPFGLSIISSRSHESHEYLLEVAKVMEEVSKEDQTMGKRRDWMRDSVREKLEGLDGNFVGI